MNINDAIKHLENALKMTPQQAKLMSTWDQVKAECRDDKEARERVIEVMVQDGCNREDVEEWLDQRL